MVEHQITEPSARAKYEHVATVLEARISSLVAPGDPLPSERELMAEFAVSRATIRHAIRVLIDRGLVYNVQGSGTFVADPTTISKTLRLTSFSEDMRERGLVASSRTISSITVPGPADVTEALEIAEGEPLRFIERLRLANDQPMAHEQVYVSNDLVGLDTIEDGASLYELISAAGTHIERAAQRIGAVNLSVGQARMLDQAVGAAAIQVVRVSFSDRGRPVEHATTTYRGDRYTFDIVVARVR